MFATINPVQTAIITISPFGNLSLSNDSIINAKLRCHHHCPDCQNIVIKTFFSTVDSLNSVHNLFIMLHGKKLTVSLTLTGLMIVAMAATRPTHPTDRPMADNKPKRNLKVLPRDISHEDLDKIMDNWKAALGVKCNFCHAPSADSTSHRLDFASDAKPEKEIARHMFKMTGKINKKYFSYNKNDQGVVTPVVTCMTCHRGNPHPGDK